MPSRRIPRLALNRGTAVHLGGNTVRFIWPCGCERVETVTAPSGPLSPAVTAKMVQHWRLNGVVLEQCKRHPTWHSKLSQVARLNAEHPQEST